MENRNKERRKETQRGKGFENIDREEKEIDRLREKR
jgi:hypothetical protein